ncbi:carboxypeptidase-like regulatory domain-containing protein [Chryseobacterium bernardetii]|uniref:carboxypeptidase-like regulatory domain-containing protein n=1 Tax=Chryseobacterium bernardetii TaxID=1241978 RepID=UPI001628FEC6|nr:carboxypeptidase-like regulatory domain-containing protein [Chryseobacterium bernardetii]
MENMLKANLCIVLLFLSGILFSQQKITGLVTDESKTNINPVLIINVSKNSSVISDSSGRFIIDADENDEIRAVKDGYYRVSKKISKEDFNTVVLIILQKAVIQIPEVQIAFKPTGNLEKDNKRLNESQKLKSLKSEMSKYMKSPLTEPLPDKSISKTFTGHDYKVGQVDVKGVIGAVAGLIKKATEPKITKANYIEFQDFMTRLKNEVNLDFLKKYGMEDEQIDAFLLYAEDTRYLSKNFRKNFNKDVLKFELQVAFAKYRQLNKLDTQ